MSVPEREVIQIARSALQSTLRRGVARVPRSVSPALTARRAGVFVTVLKQGRLRACWGTLEPQQANLAAEIVAAAQGVCTRDKRFPPLRSEEAGRLRLIVTVVLTPPEPAAPARVHPRDHGVLVRSGTRSAVVLPHEGRTVRRMLMLARQKAGIAPAEPLEIFTFRVQTISD